MTREDIIKKIEELEERKFFIDMVDRWTEDDRRAIRAINEELRSLKVLVA